MQINVVRLTRFEGAGGFKGFSTVEILLEGNNKIEFNSLAIKEFTKDGETKLIVTPAQQQSKKDQKYYDMYKVHGQLWWDVVNAVLAVYNGEAEATGSTQLAPTEQTAPTSPASTKRDMVRGESAAKKTGPSTKNPFA